jgi:AcrR family transcriptional regulator
MRNGSETRRKIHEVALRLFVEKGVSETTVRDLARAAGIAEGTLYRHYASMSALIWDLFSSNYAAFAHRIQAAQADRAAFPAKLGAVVGEFCRFFDEEPVLFRFLMLTQHQTLPRIANDDDNPVEVLHRIVSEAIAGDEIALRPAGLATTLVMGLLLQPAFGLVYGRIEPPFAQYADTITAACLRTLDA